MSAMTTRDEVRDHVRAALLDWRRRGVTDPVIPIYADVNGDGRPDFFGLDTFGRLVERTDGTGTDVSVLDRPDDGVGP